MGPCLLQNVLHHASLLTGRSKEYLIHKMFAGILEKRIESSYYIAGCAGKNGAGARESDEAFECEAKMADALQVIAERMSLWSGANYEYVASAYAAFEIMVEQ
jgi:hypothetical protein